MGEHPHQVGRQDLAGSGQCLQPGRLDDGDAVMVVGVDQHPAGSEADAYLEHSNGAGVESVLGDGTLHGHGGSDCVGGSGREALIPSPVRRNTVSWWAATATASISSWRVRSASPKSSPKRDRSSLEPTMSVNKIAPVLTVAPTQVMATVVPEPPGSGLGLQWRPVAVMRRISPRSSTSSSSHRFRHRSWSCAAPPVQTGSASVVEIRELPSSVRCTGHLSAIRSSAVRCASSRSPSTTMRRSK